MTPEEKAIQIKEVLDDKKSRSFVNSMILNSLVSNNSQLNYWVKVRKIIA